MRKYTTTTDVITQDIDSYELEGIIDFDVDNVGTVGCTLFTYRTLAPGEQYFDSEPNGGGKRVGGMRIRFDAGAGTKRLILALHPDLASKNYEMC